MFLEGELPIALSHSPRARALLSFARVRNPIKTSIFNQLPGQEGCVVIGHIYEEGALVTSNNKEGFYFSNHDLI
jgi:hypothetical protein